MQSPLNLVAFLSMWLLKLPLHHHNKQNEATRNSANQCILPSLRPPTRTLVPKVVDGGFPHRKRWCCSLLTFKN